MPVLLDRNSLYVDPRRRRMLVAQHILRLDDAPRGLAHPSCKRVSRLVQVDIPDAGPSRVHLDSLGKGVPRQLATAVQLGPVVRGPQRCLGVDLHVFPCYT